MLIKKLAVLKFDGNIDSELHVTLEIADYGERPYRTITGKLPGNNIITSLLDKWHDTYRSRYGLFRIKHGKALQDYQPELLVRMSREELEQAIVLPATKLGFQLEFGLSNTIINDIQDGDGRLPLLEFTLTQLWKQQHSGWLTHQAYQKRQL